MVGRLLARKLDFRFLDTGLMYRAVGWAALQRKVAMEDQQAVTDLALNLNIEVSEAHDGQRVRVDGEDVTPALRGGAVDVAASRVAEVPGVRGALVAKQRAIAQGGGIVMSGRDIGTVVLPDARVKVFLQASAPERAHRRHLDYLAAGLDSDEAAVLRELEERDRRDRQRAHSPLRPAEDAHVLSTDGVPVDEVVERIQKVVRG